MRISRPVVVCVARAPTTAAAHPFVAPVRHRNISSRKLLCAHRLNALSLRSHRDFIAIARAPFSSVRFQVPRRDNVVFRFHALGCCEKNCLCVFAASERGWLLCVNRKIVVLIQQHLGTCGRNTFANVSQQRRRVSTIIVRFFGSAALRQLVIRCNSSVKSASASGNCAFLLLRSRQTREMETER